MSPCVDLLRSTLKSRVSKSTASMPRCPLLHMMCSAELPCNTQNVSSALLCLSSHVCRSSIHSLASVPAATFVTMYNGHLPESWLCRCLHQLSAMPMPYSACSGVSLPYAVVCFPACNIAGLDESQPSVTAAMMYQHHGFAPQIMHVMQKETPYKG